MHLKTHVNNLKDYIEADGPYKWISPSYVKGINPASLKKNNELKWFRKIDSLEGEENESVDEVLVDYLCECLLEQKLLSEKGCVISPSLEISAMMLVKAAIYLICQTGSSYAGTHLASWRELLNENNAVFCLTPLILAYEESDGFIRDILRDFILDLYSYGPLWDPKEGMFSSKLTGTQNNFLKLLAERGYCTEY